MKNNDLVVAVNGESVEGLDHDSVVEMIRKGGDQTRLLVVDKEADSIYRLVSHPMLQGRSPGLMPSNSGLSYFDLPPGRGLRIIKANSWLKLVVIRAC